MGECDARTQGATNSSAIGATEDAAARRTARPGSPCFVSLGALRRRPDSNWCTRLCRPLPNHSATAPCRGPWYPGSLWNPAFERRRELQLVRPPARALLVKILDRLGDLLHRGRLLGRL